MKKKSVIVLIGVVVFLVLFFPIRFVYKDGGTILYRAFLYRVYQYHKIDDRYTSGYMTGLEIQFLGFSVYKNILEPDVMLNNEPKEKMIKVNDELYYEVEYQSGDNWNSCNTYDGKIKSHVDISQVPQNNDESNFDGDYDYQIVNENVIKICPGDLTTYFRKKGANKKDYGHIEDGVLDVQSDFVKDLYSLVNPSDDANIIKGLYEDSDKFSNDYILSVGIVNLIKERFYRDEEYLQVEDVENTIHKILGDDVSFVNQDTHVFSFGAYGEGICGYFYLPESNQYQSMHGCGGNWYEFFRRKVVSGEKKGDSVYLTEKLIYFKNDWDADKPSYRTIYNNYQKEKQLDYIVKGPNEPYEVKLEDYIDQASTYLYTFKRQDDRYILENVKRIS